ncbi:hypothetical protein ACJYYY_03440 [Brochothrix campestris]|uniref:hypothetical protein n=1 Tax=Brochothrix campestris TaxID=2757 RepID=UPI0038D2102D
MSYYSIPIATIIIGFIFLLWTFLLVKSSKKRISKLGFFNLLLIAVILIVAGLLLLLVFTGDLATLL